MATTLYFVQSDTLPQIKLTLTDESVTPPVALNLTGKKVSLHAKPSGPGVSFTRAATWPAALDTDGTARANGIAWIVWQDGDLNRPAGNYTAEIEILDTATNARETVYDTITLVIREDIADIAPLPGIADNTNAPNQTTGGTGTGS